MPLPTITFTGNLTKDPELRFTNNGRGVVNFSVACNERRKNEAGEWVDGDTTYLDVTSWRAPEQIASELGKGRLVMVTGTLKQRAYETKDGEKRTVFEVNADQVAVIIKEQAGTPAPASTPQATPTPSAWVVDDSNTPF